MHKIHFLLHSNSGLKSSFDKGNKKKNTKKKFNMY